MDDKNILINMLTDRSFLEELIKAAKNHISEIDKNILKYNIVPPRTKIDSWKAL